MADQFKHLEIARIEQTNPRRRRQGRGASPPDDPKSYARRLADQLDSKIAASDNEIAGFDPRRLLKLTIEGIQPQDLETLPGLKVVSEEAGKKVIILFATEAGLAEFKTRLEKIAATGNATRAAILWAVRKFDDVSAEDRTGSTLKAF